MIKTGQEKPVWRILEWAIRNSFEGIILDFRQRQLCDEDKSCGTQPAYIRVIYRRLSLLMPCLLLI